MVKLFEVVELHKKMIIFPRFDFNAHAIITINYDYLHTKLDRCSKYYVFASYKLFYEIWQGHQSRIQDTFVGKHNG